MAEAPEVTQGSPIASEREAGGHFSATDRVEAQRIWNLPNQLTMARLVLSVIFFILLAMETHGSFLPPRKTVALNVAFWVFIFAVVTDFLDGYLARKWGLVSTFGRIADPFADKIVVCGGFVMLTGLAPRLVEPWYAVIIIFREFLVSGLRSFLESRGVAFGAQKSGKLKMVFQSITIPLVIFYTANIASIPQSAANYWVSVVFYWLTIAFLVFTLLLTAVSCYGYVRRAIRLIRGELPAR